MKNFIGKKMIELYVKGEVFKSAVRKKFRENSGTVITENALVIVIGVALAGLAYVAIRTLFQGKISDGVEDSIDKIFNFGWD